MSRFIANLQTPKKYYPNLISLFFLSLVFLLPLSSCQKEDLPGELTGTWQLHKYKWLISGAVGKENKDLPRSIVLDFEDDGINGAYSGQTPTNDCTANYALSGENDITFTSIKGNTNEEPEWGKKFWRSIKTVEFWQIKRNKLWLHHNGGREVMIFKRMN